MTHPMEEASPNTVQTKPRWKTPKIQVLHCSAANLDLVIQATDGVLFSS